MVRAPGAGGRGVRVLQAGSVVAAARIVRETQQVYLNFVTAIGVGSRPARRLDLGALPAVDPQIAGMARSLRGRQLAPK